MYGVAAEVSQEVRMFLKYRDFDSNAGQQQSENHAGGPAAGDGTGR